MSTQNVSPLVKRLVVVVALGVLIVALVPGAHAESTRVIQLHEQMGEQVRSVEYGLQELKTESIHRREARDWAKQARELPRESKDFAYARAEYARASAEDLKAKYEVVTSTYYSTSELTTTIDQLIEAEIEEMAGKESLLQGDTKAEIRSSANQLQGIHRLFGALLSDDVLKNNAKLSTSLLGFETKLGNTMNRLEVQSTSSIDSLRALSDTTEALAYLMRAYADGLDYQHSALEIIAVGGQAATVIREAELVVLESFDVFKLDDEVNNELAFFTESIAPSKDSLLNHGSYDLDLTGRIDSAADKMMDRLE